MDILSGNLSKTYHRFLFPSLFSGLVTTIYVLVDMIVVGQYEGPVGAAAMACIAPFWPLFCCVSILFGLSGSVLFSRAKGELQKSESRQSFTAASLLLGIVTILIWVSIVLFDEWYLRLFGADDSILPLAMRYMKWLKWGVPLYPVGLFLGMFVRSDGSPGLAGGSVIVGGLLNIVGDVLLTFTFDLGIEGAAIASVAGQFVADVILLTHFFKPCNTLRFEKVTSFFQRAKDILSLGFPPFVGDISMSFLVILFNNQVMRYFGADELAIYGICSNVFSMFQTMSYGIGNAAQPIMAQNLGAKQYGRVHTTAWLGIRTAAILSIVLTAVMLIFPTQITCIFMNATEEIISLAAPILRRYFICLLFMPLNVSATYCLQAVMRIRPTLVISVLRGILLGGILVYLMPAVVGAGSIWYVMLITEGITAVVSVRFLHRYLFKADLSIG